MDHIGEQPVSDGRPRRRAPRLNATICCDGRGFGGYGGILRGIPIHTFDGGLLGHPKTIAGITGGKYHHGFDHISDFDKKDTKPKDPHPGAIKEAEMAKEERQDWKIRRRLLYPVLAAPGLFGFSYVTWPRWSVWSYEYAGEWLGWEQGQWMGLLGTWAFVAWILLPLLAIVTTIVCIVLTAEGCGDGDEFNICQAKPKREANLTRKKRLHAKLGRELFERELE